MTITANGTFENPQNLQKPEPPKKLEKTFHSNRVKRIPPSDTLTGKGNEEPSGNWNFSSLPLFLYIESMEKEIEGKGRGMVNIRVAYFLLHRQTGQMVGRQINRHSDRLIVWAIRDSLGRQTVARSLAGKPT